LLLILDTNILETSPKKSEDLSIFSLEAYDEAINLIEKYDLLDSIDIYLPEIVFKEISKHKLNKLHSRIDELNKLANEFGEIGEIKIEGHTTFKCNEHFEKLRNHKESTVNLIPIPSDRATLFNKILEMAICKTPPFLDKKSDKGFKDAVLLLSLIDFASKNKFEEYVLFTQDKGFLYESRDKIEDAFALNTGKHLNIMAEKNIQGFIADRFKLFLDFKKFLNEILYTEIDKTIEALKFIEIPGTGEVSNIESLKIKNESTTYEELKDNEFKVTVGFELICIDKEGKKELIDDIQKEFLIYRESGNWTYRDMGFNYKIY